MAQRKKYDVTPEQFIEAWQRSGSPQEAADKLGMPKPLVLARVSTYRKQGLKLKKMKKKSGKALDIPKLSKLIEDIDREQATKDGGKLSSAERSGQKRKQKDGG